MNFPQSKYDPANLEYSLAFHCAPAIAGVKVANLVSLPLRRYRETKRQAELCAHRLSVRGVCFHKLAECHKRVLLLAYRPRMLERYLKRPAIGDFLMDAGYSLEPFDLRRLLCRLEERIREAQGGYPHEIGVFLGYPLHDVLGFIRHRGGQYQLNGYWKVYDQPEEAKALFATYDTVRSYYCRRVLCGEKIHTIQYGGPVI